MDLFDEPEVPKTKTITNCIPLLFSGRVRVNSSHSKVALLIRTLVFSTLEVISSLDSYRLITNHLSLTLIFSDSVTKGLYRWVIIVDLSKLLLWIRVLFVVWLIHNTKDPTHDPWFENFSDKFTNVIYLSNIYLFIYLTFIYVFI